MDAQTRPEAPLRSSEWWFSFFLTALLFGSVALAKFHSYLFFHVLVEFFSIAVACGIFLVAWHGRRFLDNPYFLFLGIGYLFVGLLDLFHTMTYENMGVYLRAGPEVSPLGDPAIEFWIAGRYMESLTLLAALFFVRRRFHPHRLILLYALATSLIFASIYAWGIFPACFVQGEGLTAFKVGSEYVIAGILLLCLVLLWRRRHHFDRSVLHLLIVATGLTVVAEMAFTLYSDMFGIFNIVGHYCKLFSFFLVYKATIQTGLEKPHALLYRNLKASETMLKRSQAVGRIGGWSWDLETDALVWSEETRRIHEVPDAYVPTVETALTFYADESIPVLRDALDAARNHGTPFDLDLRFRTATGRERWVRAVGEVDRVEGRVTRIFGVIQDITERKRMERELVEAKNAAERAAREKAAFVAAVSHEVRTPLAGLIGATDLLAARDLPEESRRLAEGAHSAGHMLLAIINDILDFSKMEAGRFEIRREPVPLAATVERVVEVIRPEAEAKGLRLRIELEANLPAWVESDRTRLGQILLNLLANAVKYTREGEVVLTAAREGAPPDAEAGEAVPIRLTVRDTGPGLSAEMRAILFEPYARAPGMEASATHGTGLGLSIVKKLVEAMGGRIEVESTPGDGSRFHVRLPFRPTRPPEEETPRPARAERRPRILLAEDSPVNRMTTRHILENAGFDVILAEDGVEAVEAFVDGPVDLILMDCEMPRMDGYEATAAIRRTNGAEGVGVPILAMSGHTAVEEHAKSLEAGMNAVLVKPVDPDALEAAIRRHLAEREVGAR